MVFGNLQGVGAGMSTTWLMVNNCLRSRVSHSALGMLPDRKKTHVNDVISSSYTIYHLDERIERFFELSSNVEQSKRGVWSVIEGRVIPIPFNPDTLERKQPPA